MRCFVLAAVLAMTPAMAGCNVWFNMFNPEQEPMQPPPTPIPQVDAVDGGPSVDTNNTRTPPVDSWNGNPDVWTRQPDAGGNNWNFPPFSAAFRVGNASNVPLVLRVRPLKKSVRTDCSALLAKPQLALSKQLFAYATTWLVQPGRAIPLLPTTGNHKDGCAAMLIDGSNLPMRLVVWSTKSHGVVSQPSIVGGKWSDRLIAIKAGESGFVWPGHERVFPAPYEVHPPLAEVCKQPDETAGVAWTTPLPQGDVTIIDVAEAPDGCRMLDLFGKLGVLSWILCTPPGSFPFKVGDSFFVNPLQHGHDLKAIEGVELLSKGFRLRVGRGEDVVYFGKGKAEIDPIKGCNLNPAECGGLERPLELTVAFNGGEKKLRAGGKLAIEKGRTLHLMRARELPIADLSCIPGGKPFAKQIESVYVEVQ